MSGHHRQPGQRRTQATRLYAQLLRLYPAAHRRAFGEQMQQTFADHYRDVEEADRLSMCAIAKEPCR